MAALHPSPTLIVAAAVMCALPLAAPAANAQTGFTVTVRATADYGTGPNWEYTFTPSLPSGWYSEGNARCTSVLLNGGIRAINDVYQTELVPGTYELFDCAVSDGNPLRVRSPEGATFPVTSAVGQSYRVWKVQTEVGAFVERSGGDLVFTSVVLDKSKEDTAVVGARVTIAYVAANGWWIWDACSAVTAPDSTSRFALARCSVDENTILDGTGEWQAIYEGNEIYGAHTMTGWIAGGRTSTTQSAINLQQWLDTNQVVIVQEFIPPNCAPKDETSVSLFQVSMMTMNCDQIKALQIATKVGMAVAMIATGVGVKLSMAHSFAVAKKFAKEIVLTTLATAK